MSVLEIWLLVWFKNLFERRLARMPRFALASFFSMVVVEGRSFEKISSRADMALSFVTGALLTWSGASAGMIWSIIDSWGDVAPCLGVIANSDEDFGLLIYG